MSQMTNYFENALDAEGIRGTPLEAVARSIFHQESSSGKNTGTSNAGATGGMQIIPSTFKSVADADWNISDPTQNARAGLRYIKQLSKMANGDPGLIAAGYYGGPGGMNKARRGIAVSDPRNPNAPTTLQYAQQVVGRMGNNGPSNATMAPGTTAANPVTSPINNLGSIDPGIRNQLAQMPAQPEQVINQQAQPKELSFAQRFPNLAAMIDGMKAKGTDTSATPTAPAKPVNPLYDPAALEQMLTPDQNNQSTVDSLLGAITGYLGAPKVDFSGFNSGANASPQRVNPALSKYVDIFGKGIL